MTDIVLKDIDPVLSERIRQISQARGWDLPATLQWLLEQGLYSSEQGTAVSLDERESGALEEAISALEQVPDDSGFALIGRTPTAAKQAAVEPDQSVNTGFSLK